MFEWHYNIYIRALWHFLSQLPDDQDELTIGEYTLCEGLSKRIIIRKDSNNYAADWQFLHYQHVEFCRQLVYMHCPTFDEELFKLQLELGTI